MGLYRARFRRRRPDGTSYTYTAPNWRYSFTDPESGRRVTGSTHTGDRTAAKLIYAEAVRRAARLHDGTGNPFEADHKRLLSEHLADWQAALLAKGDTERHVRESAAQVRIVFEGCRFVLWPDISASRAHTFIGAELRVGSEKRRRRPGARTRNSYLRATRQFCAWMVQDRRAASNPLAHLKGESEQTDRRHVRRALEPDELRYLLSTVRNGPPRCGIAGPERALLYRLAAETGLRRSEIRSLTWASFDLDGNPPTVTVQAGHAKGRREDVIPLRARLVAMLQRWRAQAGVVDDDSPAIPLPHVTGVARMLRRDMTAARKVWLSEAGGPAERRRREATNFLAYLDRHGQYADFHGLRHTFGTNLALAGVAPKAAMDLMRHRDVNLTMRLYAHTIVEDRATALEALPDLDDEPRADVQTA